MRGRTVIFITFVLFSLSALGLPNPVRAEALWVSAKAYCLVDLEKGQVLEAKNHRRSLPCASTTKIMTALLALDYLDLDEWAEVSLKAAKTPPSAIGLRAGQKMRVSDLLTAALLCSANDASVVLAERVAGSEELFAYLMNKKAWVLGATYTNFVNASGLPAKGHVSSCYDLYLISRAALKHPYFRETVAKTEAYIKHPAYPKEKKVKNTNRLLALYPGTLGIKTGTTDAAGKCLVGLAQRGERQLVSVVLGSYDRYQDSIALLNEGFNRFTCTRILSSREPFKVVKVEQGEKTRLPVYLKRDLEVWLKPGQEKAVEKRVRLAYRPRAPIKKGDKMGTIEVYYNGELADQVSLVAGQNVKALPSGLWRLLRVMR